MGRDGLLAFGEGLADERRKMLFNVVRYEDCNFIYVEMLVSLGEQMMDDCGSFELASFWEIFHWTRRKKREIELCDLVNLGMQAEFEIFFFYLIYHTESKFFFCNNF